MMTGHRLDVGDDPSRHASYVGNWTQALKTASREIYRASKDAQDMSDYLLDRGRGREQRPEERAEARSSKGFPGNAGPEEGGWSPAAERAVPGAPQRRAVELP